MPLDGGEIKRVGYRVVDSIAAYLTPLGKRCSRTASTCAPAIVNGRATEEDVDGLVPAVREAARAATSTSAA